MKHRIAQEVMELAESETLRIAAAAKELKKQGKSVYDFSVGELDIPVPMWIRERIREALEKGLTRYTPAAGLPELREEIANYYNMLFGTTIDAGNVLLGNGGKSVIANFIRTIIEPNDEVLVIKPYWVSYPAMVKATLGKPKFVEPQTFFMPTLEEIDKTITDKTKLVILNYPSNPTGIIPPKEYLKKLCKHIIEKSIYLLSDEIYIELFYDERPFSASTLDSEYVVVANGFSKMFSMTGLRLGYLIAAKEIIKNTAKIASHTDGCPNSLSQYGVLGFTKHLKELDETREKLKNRLNICKKYLKNSNLKLDYDPSGAFYVFPKLTDKRDAETFCIELLQKEHIATVPGSAFGDPFRIRISYACSEEELTAGLEKLVEFASK